MMLVWIVVSVVAIAIELLTPTALVSVWIAFGGIVGFLLNLLEFTPKAQFIGFALVSIISMLVIRPMATRYLRGNVVATNADRYIGEIAIVTKKISAHEWGQVKVSGMQWHAITVDHSTVDIDEKVKVIAIEGAKLIVKPIAEKKEG